MHSQSCINCSPCSHLQDVYCLSKCKSALPIAAMTKLGVPLPAGQVEVLEDQVPWEDFKVSWPVKENGIKNMLVGYA